MGTIAITWRPSSVVYKLFTFQASSLKPLGQLEPNLAGMFLGWSSTKVLFFVPVGYSTWLPGPIICSDSLKFQRVNVFRMSFSIHTSESQFKRCCLIFAMRSWFFFHKFQSWKWTFSRAVGHPHAHEHSECNFNIGKHRYFKLSEIIFLYNAGRISQFASRTM